MTSRRPRRTSWRPGRDSTPSHRMIRDCDISSALPRADRNTAGAPRLRMGTRPLTTAAQPPDEGRMHGRHAACSTQPPVVVTRRADPDWPCDPRALAAAHAGDMAEPPQDAARDTTVQPVVDILGAAA